MTCFFPLVPFPQPIRLIDLFDFRVQQSYWLLTYCIFLTSCRLYMQNWRYFFKSIIISLVFFTQPRLFQICRSQILILAFFVVFFKHFKSYLFLICLFSNLIRHFLSLLNFCIILPNLLLQLLVLILNFWIILKYFLWVWTLWMNF